RPRASPARWMAPLPAPALRQGRTPVPLLRSGTYVVLLSRCEFSSAAYGRSRRRSDSTSNGFHRQPAAAPLVRSRTAGRACAPTVAIQHAGRRGVRTRWTRGRPLLLRGCEANFLTNFASQRSPP